MASATTRTYADAEAAIWTTISSGAALDAAAMRRGRVVELMQGYAIRVGVEAALSDLPVIHIAGTKGKGSTACMTESILRHSGLKTGAWENSCVNRPFGCNPRSKACTRRMRTVLRASGLSLLRIDDESNAGMFTSPHLVTFRERFRLNGRPITEKRFLCHFWRIWDALHSSDASDSVADAPRIPGFFHLLTLLAFAIFSAENVDVLVLEVGLGGRLDATNVVMNPVVCGVTKLDYDHVEVLGGTISAIAREVRSHPTSLAVS